MPNAIQQFLGIATNGVKKVFTGITSSSGASDGGKLVATDTVSGRIDSSFLPSGIGKQIMTATATESLVVGFVNVYNSSGFKVRKAVATGRTTKADGFVTQAYSSGDTVTVYFDNDILAGLTGLTADADYYLSDSSAGGMTTTPPTSGTNKIIQYVGKAKSATELIVDI